MAEAAEWRGKSPDELMDALQKLKKERFNLRFQKVNGQLENTSRPREVRRDIARILTIMHERARGRGEPTTKPPSVSMERATKAERAEKTQPPKKSAKRTAKKK
jgi:large subunit ribosomal protein L29